MTAQQLIAILRQCDPLSPVYVTVDDDEPRKVTAAVDEISYIDIHIEDKKE